MGLLLSFSRIPEAVGLLIARVSKWSPLHKHVTALIEVSDDPYLVGRIMAGAVRARDDRSGALPIELTDLIAHRQQRFTDLIAACPVLQCHGPERLLVTWTAVRFVDALSFPIPHGAQTIGTGRLVLRRWSRGARLVAAR